MVRKLEQYLAEGARIEADDRNLVSRTEERREKQRLEAARFAIATELTTLKRDKLARLALPDSVLSVLDEIRVIESAPARTRALKRLRGELRDIDLEILTRQLSALGDPAAARTVSEEAAWCERLSGIGDPALVEFMEQFPSADRARLRTLLRNMTRAEGSTRERVKTKLKQALGEAMQGHRQVIETTHASADENT